MADVTRARRWPAAGADGVPPADEEAALVEAARRDRRAFAPLYRRHVDPIYRYCYRRLGSREAAEDATGLVFTKALTALSTYREGSFRGWLFTIAHHTVVDALRARRPTVAVAAALEIADPAPTPEEAALAADAGRSLRTLLALLSPDQRLVVELHLAGLSGPEIARTLGRSHSAVRAIQSRAVHRLSELLATEPSEEGGDGAR
jgi:RNA polymerase sigma-70 factor (ECF subfamily)